MGPRGKRNVRQGKKPLQLVLCGCGKLVASRKSKTRTTTEALYEKRLFSSCLLFFICFGSKFVVVLDVLYCTCEVGDLYGYSDCIGPLYKHSIVYCMYNVV